LLPKDQFSSVFNRVFADEAEANGELVSDFSELDLMLGLRSYFDGLDVDFADWGDWATLSLSPIASDTRTAARRNVFLETTNTYFLQMGWLI
jgi:hypothetical protein